MGQKIGKGSRIKFGTLLISNNLKIGKKVSIGPFSVLKASTISISDNSKIQPLSIISCQNLQLGKHTHIAPLAIIKGEQSNKSFLKLGDHSRIFPFCWIDTGQGVEIGKNVGIGGHTLIFTHGVWPNYLDGAGVSFGKVIIEDNVWIPWRVFILPGTIIGENSVIGGNSLLNKQYPSNALIAGSPAKILKENFTNEINSEERLNRFTEILKDYCDYKGYVLSSNLNVMFTLGTFNISIDNDSNLNKGDLLIVLNSKDFDNIKVENLTKKGVHIIHHPDKTYYSDTKSKNVLDFVFYLRRFGIRLYTN